MKQTAHLLAVLTLLLSGCSTQPIAPDKQDQVDPSDQQQQTTTQPHPAQSDRQPHSLTAAPPLSITRDNRKFALVRMMDGGVCKNDQQGAVGTFLLYADIDDTKRIKEKKGPAIFAEFEQSIRQFSLAAFKQAINQTEIAANPFALDERDRQQKVSDELIAHFIQAIKKPRRSFEQTTTLKVEIVPVARSFQFFFNGCKLNQAR